MTLNCSGWTAQIIDDDVAQRRGRTLADVLREKGFRPRTWFGAWSAKPRDFACSDADMSVIPAPLRCAALSCPVPAFGSVPSFFFWPCPKAAPPSTHFTSPTKGQRNRSKPLGKQFAEARRSRKVPVRRTRGTRRNNNNKARSNP